MSQHAEGKREFKGQYADQLQKFAELMDRLWVDHRTSPTKAAGEEFYAWGNLDFTVTMSQRHFDDPVEIRSKIGHLDIKKEEDGKIDCKIYVDEKEAHKKGADAHNKPPANPEEILRKTIITFTHYYYSGLR